MKKAFEIIRQYINVECYDINFEKKERTLVYRKGNKIEITYGNLSEGLFALGIALSGDTEKREIFINNQVGIMVDCARNGVMKVSALKRLMVNCALLGYTKLYIYLEDCIKVEEEEHFGYMRGAYTKEEMQKIDNFAKDLNIKVVPCIETLAHLNQIFDWAEYKNINDTQDILLAYSERTYRLIENIIKTVSANFSSGEINIGMDEVKLLGKGNFLNINKQEPTLEIFAKHLAKVKGICDKYHLKVSMWGDMFFSAINGEYYNPSIDFSSEIKNSIPKDVEVIYWDYYHSSEEHYSNMIKAHKKLHNNIGFAGGLWSWKGFAPYNRYSAKTMLPAIKACRDNGIKNMMFTMWGDDGAECSKFALLPAMAELAIAIHLKDYAPDKNRLVEAISGYSYDELLNMDLPNKAEENFKGNPNPCKYLLYDDVIAPSFSGYTDKKMVSIYRESCKTLYALSEKENNLYSSLFREYACLCKVISEKIELSFMLFEGYKKGKEELGLTVNYINNLILDINEFYDVFRKTWNYENKPFGFEIQDVRIGGLIKRLEDVRMMVNDYCLGQEEKIDALEEPRFTLNYNMEKTTNFNCYSKIVSRNKL